jgi:hypothetical protein
MPFLGVGLELPYSAVIGGSGTVGFAYYVASNGNDANPGTQSQPWLTLAKVTAQSFFSNTTVYLRGGDTFTGPLTLPGSQRNAWSADQVHVIWHRAGHDFIGREHRWHRWHEPVLRHDQ